MKARLEHIKDERIDGVFKRKTAHYLYGLVYCAKCGAPFTRRTVQGKGGLHKIWKCTERLKGLEGNGCSNAIIREDELLRMISEKLGWEWGGVESFNIEMFMATVQRVDIPEKGACILKKKTAYVI